jgi:hypothetical protein
MDLGPLKKCALWAGSLEQLFDSVGILTRAQLEDKARCLRACDDRTKGENELLAALEKVL